MKIKEFSNHMIVLSAITIVFGLIGYMTGATYVNDTSKPHIFPEESKWVAPYDTIKTIYYTTDTTNFRLVNNKNGVNVSTKSELVWLNSDQWDTVTVPIETKTIDIIVSNGSFNIWLNDTSSRSVVTDNYWAMDVSQTVRYIIFKAREDLSRCEINCMNEKNLSK